MVGHAWADKPTTHMVDRLERSLAELRNILLALVNEQCAC